MALIKNANAHEIARDAIVLDLGDLSRQGQALVAAARARADQILAEARAERERVVAGAAEKGHAQGLARGLEEGRKKGADEGRAAAAAERRPQLEQLEKSWRVALERFAGDRELMLNSAHLDVLRLATLIAEKVVKRSIAIDPHIVEEQMKSVLAAVTRPTELVLRINPADLDIAKEALPGLLAGVEAVRGATIEADPLLAQGSCIASTRARGAEGLGGGEIEASVEAQLDRLVQMLLPGSNPRVRTSPQSPADPPAGQVEQ